MMDLLRKREQVWKRRRGEKSMAVGLGYLVDLQWATNVDEM